MRTSGCFSSMAARPSGAVTTQTAVMSFAPFSFTLSMAQEREPPVANIGSRMSTLAEESWGNLVY